MGKGSSSLSNRIRRHLRKKKRHRWHIDFLLGVDDVFIESIIYSKTLSPLECQLSKSMEEFCRVVVKGFGSSDCRLNCSSHLYYVTRSNFSEALHLLKDAYKKLNLKPNVIILL
jgi:sugar fermentation stimulation protein A